MTHEIFYSGASQVYWTCKALIDGRTIDHQTEIREMRGWRLGAIIHCLRHQYSWPIQAEYRGPQNIAHYSLKEGIDRAALQFPKSASALGDDGASQ